MRLLNHQYRNETDLDAFCQAEGIADDPRLFIQVFCGNLEGDFIHELNRLLRQRFPRAIILGTTTGGEIADGRLFEEGVIVSFLECQRTRLAAVAQPWDNPDSFALGQQLARRIDTQDAQPALIIAVATGLNTNGEDFVLGVSDVLPDVPLAGGLSGEYLRFKNTWIFDGNQVLTQGAIAVAFYGEQLQVQTLYSMDWMPLGRALTVNRARRNLLIELDGRPAIDTYRHYLSDEAAEHIPVLSVQFPLMVERGGMKLARGCTGVNDDGSMVFMGNFQPGDKVWFAIGDANALLDSSSELIQRLRNRRYEAILCYTCVARKALMTKLIGDEARVFQQIAPTAGFFTYGEFFHANGTNLFFNYTLTLVAMTEHPDQPADDKPLPLSLSTARVTTETQAYAFLINRTARELEDLLDQMHELARTDELTRLPNRRYLMEQIRGHVRLRDRDDAPLSLLLLDLDDFKQVNDRYGHQAGDEVLVDLARIIENVVRLSDIPGRWGGEEFLIICPNTDLHGACDLAGRLRTAVAAHRFGNEMKLTLSIGCAEHREGEAADHLIARADRALYAAKDAGKNRVCGCEPVGDA